MFSPLCTQRDLARKLIECDQPVVGVLEHGQTLELDFDIDCANSQTLGPRVYDDEPEQVWVNQRIELAPLIIDHRVTARTSDEQGNLTPTTVSIMSCERCIAGSHGFSEHLDTGVDLLPSRLEEGLYVVEVRVPLAEAKRIHLTLTSEP